MSDHETKPVDPGTPIESVTSRAEDIAASEDEAGREDTGTQGPTERPTGTSTARNYTSVDPKEQMDRDPKEPMDRESPAG